MDNLNGQKQTDCYLVRDVYVLYLQCENFNHSCKKNIY